MRADGITDENTLRVWLESRPEPGRRHEAVAIALRPACRVMPCYGSLMGHELFATPPMDVFHAFCVSQASGAREVQGTRRAAETADANFAWYRNQAMTVSRVMAGDLRDDEPGL